MQENRMTASMKALLLVLIPMTAVALLAGLFTGLEVLPLKENYNHTINDQEPPPPAPPSTATPTTVASSTGFTVDQDNVEVRSGPSQEYPVIGAVNRGQTFMPSGRTHAGDWLQFPWEGTDGWVYAPSLTVIGSGQLPVVQDVPPPPPPIDPPPPESSTPDSPPSGPPGSSPSG